MSSSSSSSRITRYDVFVSFRGEDTRKTFVSLLYDSLKRKGLRFFKDGMVRPDDVIGASNIAIVVISENYASSGWCLEELADILKFWRQGSLMVFPVYYGVKPSHVRAQTGNFGKQFRKHQREDPDKLKRWREALTELGSILGEHSYNCDKEDLQRLIHKITYNICNNSCNYFVTSSFGVPVGIDLHMDPMFKMLALGIDDVRGIGIYGRVGIGKTALAIYVRRVLWSYFNVHILLEHVNGIRDDIIQQFHSQLVQPSSLLRDKRVLLLVDGVDTIEQIDIIRLRQQIKLFGPGSRVIVTCQDKNLLLALGIEHLYQVEPMAYSEALQLLSFCAFDQIHPLIGFEKLSKRAVKLTEGIPSMIERVGLELFHRSKEEWERMLSSRYAQSYDVFLSFRGDDTRRAFTSHLHRSLVEKGVRIPDPSSGIHLGAIRKSEIALIVISENYASSRWCLEELMEILECQRKGSLTVFPVYYGIEPTDVMEHAEEFATRFAKPHRRTPDKLQRWTEALAKLGRITGEHSNNWKDEAELIQKITDDIWDKLNISRFSGLVGMHIHMERMYELLSLESELEQVREIGVCGSVGIGKTTLARYVYQQISPYFNTFFSLDTVGKIYQDHGSSRLEEELLWKHIQRSSQKDSNVTKASLRKCKVLLLVDSVDEKQQVEDIQKVAMWFGPGSRVIFTCQDKHLLLACGVQHLYQVEPMGLSKAFRLFSIHAFKQVRPPTGFEWLSERAVKLADGLPLVIAAIGSELFGRSSEEWEMVLSRYEQSYDEDTKGIEKSKTFDIESSRRFRLLQKKWLSLLAEHEQSSDQGTVGTKESSSGVSDFYKVSGISKEDWKMVLSSYKQPSDEDTKGIEKSKTFDVSHGSKSSRRIRLMQQRLLSKYKQSSDEGTLETEESSTGEDVSKVLGRSMDEWKMVLAIYKPSSDVETEISSFGVSDDEDRSRTGNTTTFNFVGMDCHIQAVCGGLMELESDNETRIVGIWGVGGIGKTTLARLVYEETMRQFHTHVFLENVGKIYQDHGSSRLQEELLWEYIQRSSKNASDFTKARLQNRKVLLIVDGVDSYEQIENVQKVSTWFGAGSSVIVTTRDKNLLVDNGVRHAYEVKCLKVHEALQLFYQLAFSQQTPSIRFKQLSVRAVQVAGRVPLALEVLASFLRGKTENDWESVLQKNWKNKKIKRNSRSSKNS